MVFETGKKQALIEKFGTPTAKVKFRINAALINNATLK